MSQTSVDDIISKLLEVRGSRPGKQVDLQEAEIRSLCTSAREVFMNQPVLLELEALSGSNKVEAILRRRLAADPTGQVRMR